MKLLDLPRGYQCLIDDEDLALVSGLTLYRGNHGYVTYSKWENGRSYPRLLHRLLVSAPRGMHVDHINGNKLDNRRSNLRVVTSSVNQSNRKERNRNNTSGIRGVAFKPHLSPKKPWHAQIMAQRRAYHLGLFATQDEAISARRAAELRYFGELCP